MKGMRPFFGSTKSKKKKYAGQLVRLRNIVQLKSMSLAIELK